MDLLIILVLIVIGFMMFILLFGGIARFVSQRKMGNGRLNESSRLKVNKTPNIYHF